MKLKKSLGNIFLILTIVILGITIVSVLQSKKENKELFIFGYKPYLITTGSMEPYMKINCLVIIKQGGYDNVKVDDVIGFKVLGLNSNVCHRIAQITDEGFVTKGDNNSKPDLNIVTKDMYVGKVVFKTNIISTINYLTNTTRGRILFIGFPILIVILIIIGIKMLKKGKKEDTKT